MSVATNTMDAIKKKMQAMKLEKENAFDKADQLEQKLNEQKSVFEKVVSVVIVDVGQWSRVRWAKRYEQSD